MNALGWQVVEKTNRLLDVNERHINDIIDNASHITKDVKDIIEIITKITGLFRVFKFFKK